MMLRQDVDTADWPLRPWIMAAICAVAGLLFNALTEHHFGGPAVPPLDQAMATFVAIASISLVLTVEQRRWTWAVIFAAGWGVVVALVGWFSASYNRVPTIFEWPFLCAIFAVLLAAPLFQTVRDAGRWTFPYARLHRHAWTDAVIGAASLAFVGVTFLLAWMIGGLFDLIGIDAIKELLRKDWFNWMLAGLAFGGAVGLLRERDGLVAMLQRLVMVVIGVLAPVLVVALVAFLISLPVTGFDKPNRFATATPLMLSLAAAAVLFANAVFGNGDEDRATNRVLRWSALGLILTVLPLALIAGYSMEQRIGQYGWTPERIWGAIAVGVAVVYGLAGWWSVAKGRAAYDDLLRPLQTKLAIGVCALAVLLALPIVDFGAISAKSQMDRLARGKMKIADFDWAAMAFDFGPKGRLHLAAMSRTGSPDQRKLAVNALKATGRWSIAEEADVVGDIAELDRNMRILPAGTKLTDAQRLAVAQTDVCDDSRCVVTIVDPATGVVVGATSTNRMKAYVISDGGKGVWGNEYGSDNLRGIKVGEKTAPLPDLATVKVEIRPVTRRQVYVDGRPVGDPIE